MYRYIKFINSYKAAGGGVRSAAGHSTARPVWTITSRCTRTQQNTTAHFVTILSTSQKWLLTTSPSVLKVPAWRRNTSVKFVAKDSRALQVCNFTEQYMGRNSLYASFVTKALLRKEI